MNHPHLFTEPEKNVWLLQLGLHREPLTVAHIAVSVVPGEALVIHSMHVPAGCRRRGIGRNIMDRMLTEIKERWPDLPVYIHAIPYGESMAKDQLVTFYARFGFERVAGHPFEMVMQRKP